MTAEQNMSFGLRMTGAPRQEIERRVADAARILRIEPLLARKPKQLSGGQRQRVAIGRAIVREPKVFLFDEPLSNLDAALRVEMRVEIARIHAEIGATMIYVTHDQVEAMTLADRIVIINHGEIEQVGRPLEVYDRPTNLFVAGFLGQPKMNFLPGILTEVRVGAATLRLEGSERDVALPANLSLLTGDRVTLGVRPDAFALAEPGVGHLAGQVKVVEQLGNESIVYAAVDGKAELIAVRVQGKAEVRHSAAVSLRIDAARCYVFDVRGIAAS
jgi:ABC-type sugar transport system ATPase subunit